MSGWDFAFLLSRLQAGARRFLPLRVTARPPRGQRAVAAVRARPGPPFPGDGCGAACVSPRPCLRGRCRWDPAVGRRFGGAAREPSEQGLAVGGGGRKQPPSCRWSALRRAGPTPGFDPGEAAGADPAWSLGGLPEHRGFPWAGRCWIRCRAAARSAVPGVRWFVF